MAKLKKIFIYSFGGRHQIQVDWDNDRHQAVMLSSLCPDSVERALLQLAALISAEASSGYLEIEFSADRR